jgi:predicted Fe-Mo cluster-binding NifX family protein
LDEKGVKVIISGGMGSGAIDLFSEKNIEVVTGAKGAAKQAVEMYLTGELISGANNCDH